MLIHREAIKEAAKKRTRTGNRGSGAKRPTFHELSKKRFQTRPPLISQFNKAFTNRGLDTSLLRYLNIAVTSVQTYLPMISVVAKLDQILRNQKVTISTMSQLILWIRALRASYEKM